MREVTWPWTKRCSVVWSTRTVYGSPALCIHFGTVPMERSTRVVVFKASGTQQELRDAARPVLVGSDLSALGGGSRQDDLRYSRTYMIAGGSNELLRNMIAYRALNIPKERVK
jgi:hypothetical protein